LSGGKYFGKKSLDGTQKLKIFFANYAKKSKFSPAAPFGTAVSVFKVFLKQKSAIFEAKLRPKAKNFLLRRLSAPQGVVIF
jgi:hypothetical protein